MPDPRDIIEVRPKPIEPPKRPTRLPPIMAKTVNLCINCVQGAGRAVKRPAERRYERHYHPRLKHGRRHLVADIGLAVGIVALIAVNAWLLIARPNIFSNIDLAWEVPSSVRVGEEFTVTLTATYDGDVELTETSFAFVVPDAVHLVAVTPGVFDPVTSTVRLDHRVAPGAAQQVALTAYTDAPEGTELDLQVTFHGSGVGQAERRASATRLVVRGIAAEVMLNAPPTIPTHGRAQLVIHATSHGTHDLGILTVVPEVVTGVTILHATPSSAGRAEVVVATGSAGTFPLRIHVERNGVRLATVDRSIRVVHVPATLSLTLIEGPGTIALGDTLQLSVSHHNPEGDVSGERFGLEVSGPLAKFSMLTGGDVEGRVAAYCPLRSDLATCRFTLTAPDRIDPSSFADGTDFSYTVTPVLDLTPAAIGSPRASVLGEPLVIRVAGNLRLAAFARYYTPEGDQIGRGPLPPRVGATTRYWVTWDIRSLLVDAERVVVRAALADGVEWTGRVAATAGDHVAFDPVTREVTWVVTALAQTVGTQFPSSSASFEVALTPTAPMAGTTPRLLEETRATSRDVAGNETTVTADAVTTALTLDQRGRESGGVVLP